MNVVLAFDFPSFTYGFLAAYLLSALAVVSFVILGVQAERRKAKRAHDAIRRIS
jgi:hypothetical protein